MSARRTVTDVCARHARSGAVADPSRIPFVRLTMHGSGAHPHPALSCVGRAQGQERQRGRVRGPVGFDHAEKGGESGQAGDVRLPARGADVRFPR